MWPNTKIVNILKTFFCSSVFISVCVFNVWPKTTLLLPVWARDTKRLASTASPSGTSCRGLRQCHNLTAVMPLFVRNVFTLYMQWLLINEFHSIIGFSSSQGIVIMNSLKSWVEGLPLGCREAGWWNDCGAESTAQVTVLVQSAARPGQFHPGVTPFPKHSSAPLLGTSRHPLFQGLLTARDTDKILFYPGNSMG